MVVDDNADAANSLAMLLAMQGHETQVAYGAQEALARMEAFRPDVARCWTSLSAGFSGHLVKPVDPAALESVLAPTPEPPSL